MNSLTALSVRRSALALALAAALFTVTQRIKAHIAVAMVLHRDTAAVSTTSRCIKAGDLVIVYERFDSMKSIYVRPGESYANRYGNFKLKVTELKTQLVRCLVCLPDRLTFE